MINLIFDRMNIPNKKSVFVCQTEKNYLSWKNIFNILSQHIYLPSSYINLQCNGKNFNGQYIANLRPFYVNDFMKKNDNFILFHVKISRPKKFQISI